MLNSALLLFSASPFQQLGQQYEQRCAKGVQNVRTFLAQALPRVGANTMTISRFIVGIIYLETYLDKLFAGRKWIIAAPRKGRRS